MQKKSIIFIYELLKKNTISFFKIQNLKEVNFKKKIKYFFQYFH